MRKEAGRRRSPSIPRGNDLIRIAIDQLLVLGNGQAVPGPTRFQIRPLEPSQHRIWWDSELVGNFGGAADPVKGSHSQSQCMATGARQRRQVHSGWEWEKRDATPSRLLRKLLGRRSKAQAQCEGVIPWLPKSDWTKQHCRLPARPARSSSVLRGEETARGTRIPCARHRQLAYGRRCCP